MLLKKIKSQLLAYPPITRILLQCRDFVRIKRIRKDQKKIVYSKLRPKDSAKRLYVDISSLVLQDAKTGIQRVVRSVLSNLCLHPPAGYEVVPVYANVNQFGYYDASAHVASLLKVPAQVEALIEPTAGDAFLGLDFSAHVLFLQRDFLEMMHQKGVNITFVVYDMLPLLRPDFFEVPLSFYFPKWLEVIMQFDGAICISEAVAKTLTSYVQHKKPGLDFDVRWFHLGADIEHSLPTQGLPDGVSEILSKIKSKLTFLMVGTIEPRKGYAQALNAFDMLWSHGHDIQLVVVGKVGWHVEEIAKRLKNHVEHNKRLFWFDRISDEFLMQLYAAASCYIAASEAEGFGLPLIEAAKYQLPIIARDIPVFREVAKANAYYFEGMKSEDLSTSILNWLLLYERKEHPRSEKMSFLTWEESVKQLKSVWLDLPQKKE